MARNHPQDFWLRKSGVGYTIGIGNQLSRDGAGPRTTHWDHSTTPDATSFLLLPCLCSPAGLGLASFWAPLCSPHLAQWKGSWRSKPIRISRGLKKCLRYSQRHSFRRIHLGINYCDRITEGEVNFFILQVTEQSFREFKKLPEGQLAKTAS